MIFLGTLDVQGQRVGPRLLSATGCYETPCAYGSCRDPLGIPLGLNLPLLWLWDSSCALCPFPLAALVFWPFG